MDGEDSDAVPSEIGSEINSDGIGDTGGITISTNNLNLTNGGQVSTSIFGQGNASAINITATGDITVDGEDSDEFSSKITSQVNTDGVGDAGNIDITTQNLDLTNGGGVSASILGQGNGGLINITATGNINIDGEASDGLLSGVTTGIGSNTVGNGGVVNITTTNLDLADGGIISADTFGQGNAGNLNITTTNLNFTDGGAIESSTFGQGNGGSINITATGDISADGVDSDGSNSGIRVVFGTEALGDRGGDITLTTTNLNLTNGGAIESSTFGQGNGGSINIIATGDITADGEDSDGFSSGISSQVDTDAVGDSGGVNISTNNLNLTNGGRVSASTFGQGNAGTIDVTATGDIIADGVSLDADSNSGITSLVDPRAVGDSGEVTISTTNLNLTNGGEIDSRTLGQGNGGAINVTAAGDITISNTSTIISSVQSLVTNAEDFTIAEGDAGGISITTNDLTLSNGGRILSTSLGRGNAGLIAIEARNRIRVDGESADGISSSISSSINNIFPLNDDQLISPIVFEELVISEGITINTNSLLLTKSGLISTTVLGQGSAGDLTINAKKSIVIDGGETGDITEFDGVEIRQGFAGLSSSLVLGNGSGGDIKISSEQLTIDNNGSITADDSLPTNLIDSNGQPGNIEIQANTINLSDRALIRAFTRSETGSSANINLQVAEDIRLENNSSISAQALANGNGGNLTINADDGFILASTSSGDNDIIARAAQGNGGQIEIFTQALFGFEERPAILNNGTNDIDASSEFGLQGDFSLNTPDFDPTTGLINLPASVSDASDQISQNPCQQGVGSEFKITGKGGLPPTVNEALNSEEIQIGLIEAVPSQQTGKANNVSSDDSQSEATPAMGWVFNDKGEVTLTAYSTSGKETQRPRQQNQHSCSSGIDR